METMYFPRGDGIHHYFYFPADAWVSGGRLFFAAKPAIDDDTNDAAAVINADWDDSALVADEVIDGVTYKKYDCYFAPADTSSIASNGAESAEYLGEYQFVPSGGDPQTFPPTDPKIPVVVIFDVKRKTTP